MSNFSDTTFGWFVLAVLRVIGGIFLVLLILAAAGLFIGGIMNTGNTGNPTWLLLSLLGIILAAIFGVLLSEVMFG